MSKYFAYDNECGFELFDTADEAQSYAQDQIDGFREQAADGWPESVESVCWGEVKEQASIVHIDPHDDEDEQDYADYHLQEIE